MIPSNRYIVVPPLEGFARQVHTVFPPTRTPPLIMAAICQNLYFNIYPTFSCKLEKFGNFRLFLFLSVNFNLTVFKK